MTDSRERLSSMALASLILVFTWPSGCDDDKGASNGQAVRPSSSSADSARIASPRTRPADVHIERRRPRTRTFARLSRSKQQNSVGHGRDTVQGARRLLDTRTGIEWVFIRGGTYTMGDSLSDASGRRAKTVMIRSFWVQRTEVTVGQYINSKSHRRPEVDTENRALQQFMWVNSASREAA